MPERSSAGPLLRRAAPRRTPLRPLDRLRSSGPPTDRPPLDHPPPDLLAVDCSSAGRPSRSRNAHWAMALNRATIPRKRLPEREREREERTNFAMREKKTRIFGGLLPTLRFPKPSRRPGSRLHLPHFSFFVHFPFCYFVFSFFDFSFFDFSLFLSCFVFRYFYIVFILNYFYIFDCLKCFCFFFERRERSKPKPQTSSQLGEGGGGGNYPSEPKRNSLARCAYSISSSTASSSSS